MVLVLELIVCTTVVRVGETVVVVVEVETNVDVVEAVVEVGSTNTVSVNVVWLYVAYLTAVVTVVVATPPALTVCPAVVKVHVPIPFPEVSTPIVAVEYMTFVAVFVAAVVAVLIVVGFTLVAEVIVLTVTGEVKAVGSSCPILLLKYSVKNTDDIASTLAIAKGLLPGPIPNVGS